MAWTIPVGEVAGLLAVSFTTAFDSPPEASPPIQRPSPTDAAEPADPADPAGTIAPPDAAPAGDPTAPTPPTLPPADGEAGMVPDPPSPSEGSTTDAPIMESGPVADPFAAPQVAAPQATDDEVPGAAGDPPAEQRLLRPTTKRGFFTLSMGGASTNGSYYSYYAPFGSPMGLQIEAVVGSHGKNRPNLGGGLVLQYRPGLIHGFSVAGRFQWDRPLWESFSVYSSFDATVGIAGSFTLQTGDYYYGYYGGYDSGSSVEFQPPGAQIGVGWGVRAILAERFMLFVRPIAPNLIAPAYNSRHIVQLRWDVGGGLGIVW